MIPYIGATNNKTDDTYEIEKNPTIAGASVSVGYNAKSKDGNIAIGAYSDATDTTSTTPYVFVGNSTLQRRITNVANGTAATDVATVGQMEAAIADTGAGKANIGADNIGSKLTVDPIYKKDINGDYILSNGKKIIDQKATDAATNAARTANEDAWGATIGTGKVEADNGQLVTGKTVYSAIQDMQNQSAWKLTTNREAANSAATISPGTTVDFSPAVDGKNGTADHKNVTVSHTGSNVTIGLNKDIILGEASEGKGGSLNVYSNSSDSNNNISNHVKITGSTISVNYPKANTDGTTTDTRGVIIGVGEDENSGADGYIAFNNASGAHTYLHSATDAPKDLQDRLEYKWNDVQKKSTQKKYIANLDDGITFTGDVQKDVPKDYTQTPTKLNTTLNITGGAKTEADLTAGNIGVVSTPAAESADGTQNQASKLEIKLNKDLKGITSITGQSTTGAKIELGENGTTISGGDVNVSGSKVTGLAEGEINDKSTDAITGKQLDSVRTALTNSLSVNAGWGLKKENNTIRLNRNLGQEVSLHYKDNWDAYDATLTVDDTCLILGGEFDAKQIRYCSDIKYHRDDYTNWGAKGTASIISGGADNLADGTADAVFGGMLNQATGTVTDDSGSGWNTVSGGAGNLANGSAAAVFGGWVNTSTGSSSTVTGGAGNLASGSNSAVFGGESNISSGSAAVISGGVNNRAMSVDSTVIGGNKNATINLSPSVIGGRGERGYYATVIGGTSNYASGFYSLALGGGGYQYGSDSEGNRYVHEGYYVRGDTSVGIDGGSTGNKAAHSLAAGNQSVVTVANGTAIGYQATTDEKGTIAFGHDKGDISGYTVRWKQKATSANGKYYDAKGVEITKDQYEALRNPDYTFNDYSKDPTITEDTHKTAAYNRLVKAADGQNAHDAVVMEQLKPYTKSDASNIGSNLKTYTVGDDGETITEAEASTDAKNTNENAWGAALGNGSIADPTESETNDPEKNGSQQLVTGGTVYEALHGGLDDIVIGHDGKDGSIGLVGPTGPKGEDGTTIIKTEKGADGIDGKNGKDGITRIVYGDKDNPNDKHTVATLDDGMKYAGDTGTAANVKLDHQLTLSGTTFNETDKKYKETDWTSDNIAVVSSAADETTGDATMYLKLNKDLNLTDKGSVRFGDKDSSTTLDASGLTIKSTVTEDGNTKTVNGPSVTKNGINGGGKQITNIGDGITTDGNGKYTVTDENKGNAANISDVQNIVNDAKKDLTNGANGLNSKANVDASNIGENMKDAKGNKASVAKITKNKEAWASAIGTDTVAKGNKQLVTSDAVATALDSKADKTYVDKQLDTKANKSDVYTKDQTYSKTEVDSKVSNITTGLDGKAGKDLDNISDKGQQVIHNIAKDAVEVVDGTNTTVTKTEGTNTTPTKYAVNVEGKGKVASGDTGLISGDTLYNEVHVNTDGSYIKGSNTVGKNLSNLDTGLKTTSDLIHTNTKGDTIQIGGNSTATKIDVSGKDGKGNTTGRVITGVVSDANDPNSAANVGYVNGLTAANTQQIYRDMNNAYSRLDTNINRAAAGSNALAALHPLDFDPADKASFAVGYGHYHNANAAAVGAFYQPNANTMVNMGISLGNGDPGFNAGVSFKIGKGSTYNGVSKAEMAQTIHDQAAEISTIKANDAAKDKRIDALEKENQEMKKQIQEILARLNG